MAPVSHQNSCRRSTQLLTSILKTSVVARRSKSCSSLGTRRGGRLSENVMYGNGIGAKLVVEDEVDDGPTDLTFLVGSSKKPFYAHTLRLAGSSTVFRTMLQSTFFAKPDIITIVDVTPLAFELLLKSIYHGVTSLTKHPGLATVDLALDAFYGAHKYNLTSLENFLIKFIHRATNIENCLQILHHAEFYGIVSLQSKCWSIIEMKTTQAVRSNYFPFISWNILCGMLENSRLKISEFELFEGVLRWCNLESHLEKNKGKTLCQLIGVAIYKIRFPLMSQGEFRTVMSTGILKSGEIADLQSNYKRNKTYCHLPRRNVCFCRKNRMHCPLCFYYHSDFVAVDGLIGGYKTNHGPCHYPSHIMDGPCECMKYFSCPAFPNGTTAEIIDKLGGLSELKNKLKKINSVSL